MKVSSWYGSKGRWCARHLCGDPPHISEWQVPAARSGSPVWVELRCDFCLGVFVTVIECPGHTYRNPPTEGQQ